MYLGSCDDDPSVAGRAVTSLRIACLPLLAAPLLWCVAVGEGALRETPEGSHVLRRCEAPPQFAVPPDPGSGKVWSDLRASLALPGAGLPALPRTLPSCGSPSLEGATQVEEGVLHCASVHPPPLASVPC
jgi:hypothetical protein